jgi:hypothetical protein
LMVRKINCMEMKIDTIKKLQKMQSFK